MAGCRPLTPHEERQLLRVVRQLPPRDRTLITLQWLSGFRIAEVLSLRIGSVMREGRPVSKIGVAPRNLKGRYGRTRWIPVLPELERALEVYIEDLRRGRDLANDQPLFISRQRNRDGSPRALTTESARLIVHDALRRAGIENDGRLGTHVLRKTWARNVYRSSGNDIALLRVALNHSDVRVTQRYLEVDADALDRAMRAVDFTRVPRGLRARTV